MDKTSQTSNKAIEIFKRILPSPFTIAILLSIVTIIIAQILTKPADTSHTSYLLKLITSWEDGLWDSSPGGLYFAFQMMLILVLGHVLALTPFINRLIQQLIKYCTNTSNSVIIISLGAMIIGLINWGMGLIFGAILARKVGEKFAKENRPINYGLVGAAAYVAMMVWHGGLSGSATTKSMEEGYIPEMMRNIGSTSTFPDSIPFNETIGSSLNITVTIACLIIIPLFLYFLSKKTKNTEKVPHFKEQFEEDKAIKTIKRKGAEKLDYSRAFGIGLGSLFVIYGIYKATQYEGESTLGFIQLNFINFMFLGLGLTLHQTITNFGNALQKAIGDVSGILIQFPFYFGILAIMNSSGLINLFSDSITSIASAESLPIYTFISASIVNFFVPSGGGQWAVQGPIILETAQQLGSNIPKNILAMAYGDQLSNMLQPFWALPLLGITKLKPQQLLPYTFLLCMVGLIIFIVALVIF
ncbi:MAG: TIGR00366 family protein [Brumimicrobium sp.]